MIAHVHNIARVNCCTCTYFFQKQTGSLLTTPFSERNQWDLPDAFEFFAQIMTYFYLSAKKVQKLRYISNLMTQNLGVNKRIRICNFFHLLYELHPTVNFIYEFEDPENSDCIETYSAI